MGDVAAAVEAARQAYAELGGDAVSRAGARFVENRAHPLCWDANHVGSVGETGPVDVAALLGEVERGFGWTTHRQVRIGPAAPPALAAHLAVAGYGLRTEVELVLPDGAEVAAGPAVAGLRLRPVVDDADRSALLALTRLDHEETAATAGHEPWAREVTRQIVAVRLGRAPAVRFVLASVGGEDVGFFSSFVGPGSMGIVENLFTAPSHRGRGVARALIRRCCADARAAGAGPVCIGADPDDWPGAWYRALGFEPTSLRLLYDRDV